MRLNRRFIDWNIPLRKGGSDDTVHLLVLDVLRKRSTTSGGSEPDISRVFPNRPLVTSLAFTRP